MRATLGLVLAVIVSGCAATEVMIVPQGDWRIVPEKQRVDLDRAHDAQLASARAELVAARAGLARAEHLTVKPQARPALPDPARTAALAQIDANQQAWQRANLAWNQQRVVAATARLAMLDFQRELARAKAVDHCLPVGDNYEVAPYIGQFARAQATWYAAATSAAQARDVLELANARVSSSKEAYAQLMRGTLGHPGMLERERRMQLTGWAINDEIGHRQRMKYVLSESKPMLVRR